MDSAGPIDTPVFGKKGMSEAELQGFKQGVQSLVPLGRLGRPEEVASLAVYLGGDGPTYITGADFPVDGGLLAT